ncbi:MAG: glutamate-5-semialdehyde dehydrogenase [Deltaproteobacteria bacterium]|nr:glutamate-5-semialdehyde dehydrogenase [Deltaproteobacteria bacterium]
MTDPAGNARAAQRAAMRAGGDLRSAALLALDGLLDARRDAIDAANQADLVAAKAADLDGPLLDRLALSPTKLDVLRGGVRDLASRPDPVGAVRRHTRLDDGLELRLVSSPLGVLLIVFESRPDAVIQIGSLAMRSGNAVLLKGGSEASATNRVLVQCLRDALQSVGLPSDLVIGVEGRAAVGELLTRDDAIDLVIPRGSGKLVRTITDSTRIPVLGHAEGVCHVYLDAGADPHKAARIVVDGVTDYPAACNATETILVHRDFVAQFQGVREALLTSDGALVEPSTDADWGTEYGTKTANVRIVDSLDEAIDHIHTYGSGHTDAIVTEDEHAARRFLAEVDSASVVHNASTRFADGYRYGLGAEVGIATGRLHARGPVGVDGLLTTRWLLQGGGHIVSEYSRGERSFSWADLLDPS